jgi:hypothetical protein
MEMETILDELSIARNEAIENNDLETFFEKSIIMEDMFMESAFSNFMVTNFQDAHALYSAANQLNKESYELLKKTVNSDDNKKNENESYYGDISEKFEFLEKEIILSHAFSNFSLGQANKAQRNPGGAIEFFREAKKSFDLFHEKSNDIFINVLSDYSEANIIISEGLEELLRGDFGNAKSAFLRAKIQFENMLEESIPSYMNNDIENEEEYENFQTFISMDQKSCEIYYYLSDSKDQFNQGNFNLAQEQSEKLCNIFTQSIEPFLDEFPKSIKNMQLGEYHSHLGHKYLAEGEVNKEKEQWDESLDCYKKAKYEWEKGANFYLKSGSPQARMLQESLLNLSSNTISGYVRQCKKERELKTKIKDLENEMNDLRQSLAEAIKPAGVTVNNTQEMVSTVEQNVQIIQTIETKVSKNIKKLLSQLKKSNIEKEESDKIKKMANKVLNSNKHGHQFLEQAKKFTKDITKIVENLGEKAKPFLPIISALALLLL